MADPMTLREAVEIVLGREMVMRPDGLRAEAILDAAVDAHEAREGVRLAFDSRPMNVSLEEVHNHMRSAYETLSRTEKRLRALERGEDGK